jgi:hypothetical protein
MAVLKTYWSNSSGKWLRQNYWHLSHHHCFSKENFAPVTAAKAALQPHFKVSVACF